MRFDHDRATSLNSKFLETVSHEIRTPLNTISGMAQLLADTKLNTSQREFVDTIQTAGYNLLSLVNNLLDVTKLRANELELSENLINVGDELQAAASDVNQLAQEKGISISVECTPDVPGDKILDQRRFRQCLSNLLNNAIKFTEVGKVSVSCWVDQDQEDGGTLYVSVTDTGPGIATEDIKNIFTPLHQQDEAAKCLLEGSAMGLRVTRELALAMGGDVEITSPPDCGSTFTLSIRYATPLNEPEEVEDTSGHILIIEDNKTNQRLIQLVLEKLGHSCDLAVDGKQGFEMFLAKSYDLILMDLHMPVMDGFESTAAIRSSDQENNTLPIIALTADVRPGIEQRIKDAGMNAYISKPFEVPTLATTIATFLAITSTQNQEQLRQA